MGIDSVLDVLDQTRCTTLLYDPQSRSGALFTGVKQHRPQMVCFEVPSVRELLDERSCFGTDMPSTLPKTWAAAANDVVAIFHTGGKIHAASQTLEPARN